MHQNAFLFRIDNMTYINPNLPEGLLERVLFRIEAEKRKQIAQRRLLLSGLFFTGSLTALIPIFGIFWDNLLSSGFGQIISLLFLDMGSVIANWQDWGLGILESLPAVSIAGLLSVLLALLIAAKFIFKFNKIAFANKKLNI